MKTTAKPDVTFRSSVRTGDQRGQRSHRMAHLAQGEAEQGSPPAGDTALWCGDSGRQRAGDCVGRVTQAADAAAPCSAGLHGTRVY